MAEGVEVVVVGAGVMGLAAARAAAAAGRAVVVLERAEIGHQRGSSHGSARVFRVAYPDPAFVRMGLDAAERWAALSEEAGHELIRHVPAVSVGEGLDGLAGSMRAGGATIETVDARDAVERFPALRLDGHERAIIEAGAGVIAADRAREAFRAGAARLGAIIRETTTVTEVRIAGDAAIVRTDEGEVRARAAIVTAGPWAKGLLAGAGIDLPTWCRVETVGFFDGPADEVPIVLEWGEPAITYLLPTPEGHLKGAEHLVGPTRDPDDQGGPDPDSVARVGAWLTARVDGAGPSALWAETCPYTMTEDESFILERHGPIVVGSACSGHAFKFAPLIGARLAELAQIS